MPFRRRRRATLGRSGVKHAGTSLDNIGAGSTPTETVVIETEGGARGEGVFSFKANSLSDHTCEAGDLIKYVNVHIAAMSRGITNNHIGVLEYAVFWKREGESSLTSTQLGTLTLGTVATNRYRNDCLWTGVMPFANDASNVASLTLKMPRSKQHLKVGEALYVSCYFRSNNSADVGTDEVRLVVSYNFKAYS